MTTALQIRKALDRLDRLAEATWKRHEEWQAANPGDDKAIICEGVGLIGRCTDTSVWLAERLGGVIHGYQHSDNPTAVLGEPEHGHDFVIVDGRWLVDWWAKDTYQERDLYDLQDPVDYKKVLQLYGDPDAWSPMSSENFLKYKAYIRSIRESEA